MKSGKSYYDAIDFQSQIGDDFLVQPHPIQVISILRFIGCDKKQDIIGIICDTIKKIFRIDLDKLQNHLMQVKTGEGKSIILGAMSLMLALMGQQVYCVCYSSYLSNRDYQFFRQMFEAFQVQDIVIYGTFAQISQLIINQSGNIRELVSDLFVNKKESKSNFKKKKKKQNQLKRILLVDQIDTFFSKDFYGNTYNPVALFTNQKINQLIKFIWSKQNDNQSQIQQLLFQHKIYEQISQEFKDIIQKINYQFRHIIRDLKTYNKTKYVVQDGRIGYKQLDGISFNTVLGYQTMFHHLCQFRKGKIDQKSLNIHFGISINCGMFSYAQMIQKFDKIFGLSGTLEHLSLYQLSILKRYNIDLKTFAPSVYGGSKLQKKPILIEDNQTNHFFTLAKTIIDGIKYKSALLIFFQTQQKLNNFFQSKQTQRFKDNIRIVTEKTLSQDRDNLVQSATKSQSVTFFTASYGRGTDFVTFDPIIKQQGVAVIQTFLSEQLNQQIQIQGRTARQGSKGSYQMILNLDQLNRKYQITKEMIAKATQNQSDSVWKLLQRKRQAYLKKINQKRQQRLKQAKQIHELSMQKRKLLLQNKLKRTDQFFFDKSNLIEKQQTHYIFVLDDSGSMSGQKWKDLMQAFQKTINFIKMIQQAQKFIRISILIEGTTCKIHQQNISPKLVNMSIQPRYDENNFADTFNKAYTIMLKYIEQSKIIYIFMTDGGCSYPTEQVEKIKILKTQYPQKIQYFGIQFQTSGETMKKISSQLEGKNTISNNVTELTNAFAQTVSKRR